METTAENGEHVSRIESYQKTLQENLHKSEA